ncbi:hypothetical protein DMI69_00395 [Escherichia coli]|nr:hypothetical protein [Escherichia coli]
MAPQTHKTTGRNSSSGGGVGVSIGAGGNGAGISVFAGVNAAKAARKVTVLSGLKPQQTAVKPSPSTVVGIRY